LKLKTAGDFPSAQEQEQKMKNAKTKILMAIGLLALFVSACGTTGKTRPCDRERFNREPMHFWGSDR